MFLKTCGTGSYFLLETDRQLLLGLQSRFHIEMFPRILNTLSKTFAEFLQLFGAIIDFGGFGSPAEDWSKQLQVDFFLFIMVRESHEFAVLSYSLFWEL